MEPRSADEISDGLVISPEPMQEILIREIAPTDAEAAAQLSAELGYPAEAEEMKSRIEQACASVNQIVYVACLSDVMVGWIDAAIVQHLSTGPFGEIGGLIVASKCRGRRVGRELLTRAERWVESHGVTKMVVRSRITREAAHRFYLREGYLLTKTSAVFSKQLNR